MPTEKLFYENPYLHEFTATILRKTLLPNNRYAVVLDRTAFYPEGGGQPFDTGTLNEVAVVDVQTGNDEISHITDGDPGDLVVVGRVDWRRRFDHMQQHTGEHILSGIFLATFQAQNVGFHLNSSTCQIDVTLPSLSPDQLWAVEAAANQVIFDNLPVAAQFVGDADLPGYKLRKEPGREFAQIRLVSIKDCDCCPCGGTHVGRTGEVGLLKIRGWEKRKNNIRVDFVCGGRALEDYRLKHEISRSLSVRFSVPVDGVLPALEKTLEKQDLLLRELAATRKTYHEELSTRLLAEAENGTKFRIVSKVFQGYGAADLQDFAARITAVAGGVCLLSSIDSTGVRAAFFFAAAPDFPFNMSELLKSCLVPSGGKGGGNATQAQGGAPTDNPAFILSAAQNQLLNNLKTRSEG